MKRGYLYVLLILSLFVFSAKSHADSILLYSGETLYCWKSEIDETTDYYSCEYHDNICPNSNCRHDYIIKLYNLDYPTVNDTFECYSTYDIGCPIASNAVYGRTISFINMDYNQTGSINLTLSKDTTILRDVRVEVETSCTGDTCTSDYFKEDGILVPSLILHKLPMDLLEMSSDNKIDSIISDDSNSFHTIFSLALPDEHEIDSYPETKLEKLEGTIESSYDLKSAKLYTKEGYCKNYEENQISYNYCDLYPVGDVSSNLTIDYEENTFTINVSDELKEDLQNKKLIIDFEFDLEGESIYENQQISTRLTNMSYELETINSDISLPDLENNVNVLSEFNVRGDWNQDNKFNLVDVVRYRFYVAEAVDYVNEYNSFGKNRLDLIDINKDDEVNLSDLIAARRKIVGLPIE